MPATRLEEAAPPRSPTRAPAWGLGLALVLIATAMALPAATGWDVHVRWFPPLHAQWDPRLGVGTVPALLLALLSARHAIPLARDLSWRRLLVASWALGVVWMLTLAFVDGPDGVGRVLDDDYEYLQTARATTDVSATLHEYVERIPYAAEPRNWPVHVAGHPPGALLFFVALVRLGLGSGFAAGTVVTLLAATTPLAVMVTARALGAEQQARLALPFLVVGPAAIWQTVSADAMFAAVAAWGLAALAVAATRRSAAWSLVAGHLLGCCVMFSYGLPLLGILAVTVLLVARSWYPLPFAAAAALAVVLAFHVAGFSWWEGLEALHGRYWDGVASNRPASYWMWGNIAALLCCAGPVLGAGVANALGPWRAALRLPSQNVLAALSLGGLVIIAIADLSQMSKAEVERIWLPFVPWLLLTTAFLPERWRVRGLAIQLGFALVVAHLLWTDW